MKISLIREQAGSPGWLRTIALPALIVTAVFLSMPASAAAIKQKTFTSPEKAVQALVDAVGVRGIEVRDERGHSIAIRKDLNAPTREGPAPDLLIGVGAHPQPGPARRPADLGRRPRAPPRVTTLEHLGVHVLDHLRRLVVAEGIHLAHDQASRPRGDRR